MEPANHRPNLFPYQVIFTRLFLRPVLPPVVGFRSIYSGAMHFGPRIE